MQTKYLRNLLIPLIVAIALLIGALGALQTQAQEPTGRQPQADPAFTYQGRLTQGTAPYSGTCDFQFSLYDALSGGAQIGSANSKTGVAVQNGYFNIELFFGNTAFQGDDRYLEIGVDCGGGATTLSPRAKLTRAPQAQYAGEAGSVEWSAVNNPPAFVESAGTGLTLSGTEMGIAPAYQLSQSCASDEILKWDGSAWTCASDAGGTSYTAGTGIELNGNQFSITSTYQLPQSCTGGQIPKWNGSAWACAGDDVGSGATAWNLVGNGGATYGTHFIGTTDKVSFTMKVSNTTALRLAAGDANGTPNVIGGNNSNIVSATVEGGFIGGGGMDVAPNRVAADYASVGGGAGNEATANYATVGGGASNQATESYAVVGGGQNNLASGGAGMNVVGGGFYNRATGSVATVGGGMQNSAGGQYAAIPGGNNNTANGDYSFAAGRQAQANHQGAFVWADSTDAAFASTAQDQFAVRAGGGINLVGAVTISNSYTLPAADGANGQVLQTNGSSGVTWQSPSAWNFTGNSGTSYGTNFIGTTDEVSVTIKTYNQTAMRFAPTNYPYVPNIIGGYEGNEISAGAIGSVIGGGGGGGGHNEAHRITADGDYSVIGGGRENIVSGSDSVIGGGHENQATNGNVVIGGGQGNVVSGYYGVVGGGYDNVASGRYSIIGGGASNKATGGENATISGGEANVITATGGAKHAAIGGGYGNVISGTDDYSAEGVTISGGKNNAIRGGDNGVNGAAIGGGEDNAIRGGEYAVNHATIGGGENNAIRGGDWGANHATIGGGEDNAIRGNEYAGNHATISGGKNNVISASNNSSYVGNFAAIGGGENNIISGDIVTGSASSAGKHAVIGGGYSNIIGGSVISGRIQSVGEYAVIGGGSQNIIGGNVANGTEILELGKHAVIGGGQANVISGTDLSVGEYAVIGGGTGNKINGSGWMGSKYAVIGGGQDNTIRGNDVHAGKHATIGGGYGNIISGSGISDGQYATIGGGYQNVISDAAYAVIPGGSDNRATGDYSFAAGEDARAVHSNSFVWSDGSGVFSSTASNQFAVQATGGITLSIGSEKVNVNGNYTLPNSGGSNGDLLQLDSSGDANWVTPDMLQFNPRSSAPATCSASTKGAMAYANSDNQFCFCNGTAWKQVYMVSNDCTW